MKTLKILFVIFLMTLTAVSSPGAQAAHTTIRKQAHNAYQQGNWNDAYQLYGKLCLEVANDPKKIGSDLLQAWQCLRNLNRIDELDEFREKVIARHADN